MSTIVICICVLHTMVVHRHAPGLKIFIAYSNPLHLIPNSIIMGFPAQYKRKNGLAMQDQDRVWS